MSLAVLGRPAGSALAHLRSGHDQVLVGLAVAGAALVGGHIVLVRKRPQDAGAGAGSGAGRQHRRAGTNHPSGDSNGRRRGLPVQHAGHLEQGDGEAPNAISPAPSSSGGGSTRGRRVPASLWWPCQLLLDMPGAVSSPIHSKHDVTSCGGRCRPSPTQRAVQHQPGLACLPAAVGGRSYRSASHQPCGSRTSSYGYGAPQLACIGTTPALTEEPPRRLLGCRHLRCWWCRVRGTGGRTVVSDARLAAH
jgi:hypothetical protein